MSAVLLAQLEIGNQVERVGAYAGLAAILGLAVLSLLYFGQARELKRLREWAGDAPEAAAQRAAQQAAGVGARPVAAPAPQAQRPQQPGAQPGRPAGAPGPQAAPPTTATPGNGQPRPRQPVPAGTGATAPGQVPAAATGSAPLAPAPKPGVGAPATAAGAGAAAAATAGAGAASRPASVASTTAGPGGPAGSPARSAAATTARPPGTDEPHRRSPWLLGGLGAALVAIVVVLGIIFLGGGGDDGPTNAGQPDNTIGGAQTTQAPSRRPAALTSAQRGRFTVQVFNGTSTGGLARQVNDRITQRGYRASGQPTTDTANQARAKTVISYAEASDAAAARDVARILGVPTAQVQPSSATSAPAGTTTSSANVIVTLGADQAP